MTLVTRSAKTSADTTSIMRSPQITGIAGEDIDIGAPCYIKSSDGLIYMSNGTSANEAAEVVGFALRTATSTEPITLVGKGGVFHYSDKLLTAGDLYYIGTTKGRLDTASTTGDPTGVAQALDTERIRVFRDSAVETTASLIASNAVTTAKILDANVTIAKLEAALLKGVETVALSFESNEQTVTKVYFPFKVTINKLRGIVMKAIAGTDNGTITAANSSGNMSGGVITATASDALDTAYSVTPTTNNIIAADSYIQLTVAKSTAGGKVLISIEYTRTA